MRNAALSAFAAIVALQFVPQAFAAPVDNARKPDFSGVWQIAGTSTALTTVDGAPVPLRPEAVAQYRDNQRIRTSRTGAGDPMGNCLPPGVPRVFQQRMPFRIQQRPQVIAMLFQWNHLYRLVYLDVEHFESIAPAYFGQSVGRWEGDALIIDSNGFNAQTWLDDSGLPHSEALHVTERWSLADGGKRLESRVTIDDPQTFSKPWQTLLRFQRRSGTVRDDDYCLGRVGKESRYLQTHEAGAIP